MRKLVYVAGAVLVDLLEPAPEERRGPEPVHRTPAACVARPVQCRFVELDAAAPNECACAYA